MPTYEGIEVGLLCALGLVLALLVPIGLLGLRAGRRMARLRRGSLVETALYRVAVAGMALGVLLGSLRVFLDAHVLSVPRPDTRQWSDILIWTSVALAFMGVAALVAWTALIGRMPHQTSAQSRRAGRLKESRKAAIRRSFLLPAVIALAYLLGIGALGGDWRAALLVAGLEFGLGVPMALFLFGVFTRRTPERPGDERG